MRNFIRWCERHHLSEKTTRNYANRIADFATWLDDHAHRLPQDATWRDVQKYASTKPFTHSTRNGIRCALTAFYRSCGRKDGGPAWAVEVPKRKRGRYRGLKDAEEKERILEAARSLGPQAYAICAALYYQALRREDAAKLRWENIKDGVISIVRKCNLEYEREVHPKLLEALRMLPVNGSRYVFPGRTPGTHISPATVWMVVRLAGATAGLGRVTPHMLRHTAIAAFNDATRDLRAAADFAGHTDTSTTMIYTRTTVERMREGYAAL